MALDGKSCRNCSLGPCSAEGEKCPRAKLAESGLGKGKGRHPFPSQDYLSARFARRFCSPLSPNAELGPRLQNWLASYDFLSVQMRLAARSRMESRTIVCYLGGVWRRSEALGWIYGRFPPVDPSGLFAGVPNLGKPYIEQEPITLSEQLPYLAYVTAFLPVYF